MAKRPEWLDDELVCEALGGEVDIISTEVNPAVPLGDHYLSTLLRVAVVFKSRKQDGGECRTANLIMKTFPEGVMYTFIKGSQLLDKEIIAYRKILPLFESVLDVSLTPKTLPCSRKDVLVLEDLKLRGFEMVDRIARMDRKHCEASIEALADFHAASFLLHEKDPDLFEEVKKETLYVQENVFQRSFVVNNFKSMADEFESSPELRKYSERLRSAGEANWHSVVDAVKPRDDELNVFNHGDFWTTNIMFKHDEKGDVLDVNFVDLQFCRWSSPAMDLQMFFNTSIRDRADIPSLVASYLDRLNRRLPRPRRLSKPQLESALRRTECFALTVTVCLLPICTLDAVKPLEFEGVTFKDFENNFPKENPYVSALRDPRFRKVVPEFLDYFIDIGVL